MKLLKKGLSLCVTLAMLMQVLCFTPKAETVNPVDLGEAVYVYNVTGGDVAAMTDGDDDTALSFDRRNGDGTWIAAVVYDAGEGNTFNFNQINLKGTGVHFFGGFEAVNGEYDLLDIAATIDTSVDYSGNIGQFADEYGLEEICNIENGNYYVDDTYNSQDVLSYRYFVAVIYRGWTSASVNEIYVNYVEPDKVAERIVAFGGNVTVTVDGEAISSGDGVYEGAELSITPVLGENEVLDSVTVNGAVLSAPYTYTVGAEDIEIVVTAHEEAEPEPESKTELGAPVYVFNSTGGNPANMTDGDSSTAYVFGRAATSPTWIVAAVYDAGEGNAFEFNRIELESSSAVFFCGTNSAVNGDFNLLDIAGTCEEVDYTANLGLFAESYGLTELADLTNDNKNFSETQSYRYFVAVIYSGWPNGNVSEITLKLLDPEELLESRSVVFGSNITVTVDGEEISSGDSVAEGTELTITPVLGENEVLDGITVNGELIDGSTYVVGDADIEIALASHVAEVKRAVTFGGNVTVTAAGEKIASGDKVLEGTELSITPMLDENEVLDSVTVNGAVLSAPYTYTVGAEDITIVVTSHEVTEPVSKTELGAPVYVFNSTGGNPANMTDGDSSTAYIFGRAATSPTWIVAAVYDAGEGNAFEFNRIELESSSAVFFCGTNSAINGDFNLLDIAGTCEEVDYTANLELFAESYGLTELADLTNDHKNFSEIQSYRYFVAVIYSGWPNGNVSEITLKLLDPEELLESRSVAFGSNITVTVDGEEISSGDTVKETKTLKITPILGEGEVLSKITVNGAAIDGDTYVVGSEDITIDFTIVAEREITFGSDVAVSVDGVSISSGSKIMEGRTLKITPVISADAVLDKITVNGTAIDGDTYTVGGEDIIISYTVIYKRTVTFGDNITVTVDGETISSGDTVLEGSVLEITPVLGEGEVLDQITVNGAAISGSTYTVGGENITIEAKLAEVDPDAVSLGTAAYVYNIPSGNVDYMTDGLSSTSLSFSRKNLAEQTWISVAVYDAGEGNTFDFNSVKVESSDRVRLYGTNEAVNGSFDLRDIAGTIEQGHDYSQDDYFAECYGLTSIGDLTNSSKSFNDTQSYRYFVVALSDGWANNTVIYEIALSNKIVCAQLGEVVYAGGEYAIKSGQWSSTAFTAEYTADDSDLGIINGSTAALSLWGWVGGSDVSATTGAGVVTFKLYSEIDTYADVKIVGNEKRDDRDFTVWIEGENGETDQGYMLTTGYGESLGNLTLYTIKNIKVFSGINKITIGSSQFGYSPDFAMAVLVDKSGSLVQIGQSVFSEGNSFDFGSMAASDKFSEEFLPGKSVGDEIGSLPIADGITAEIISENGGSYNLIALADSGSVTVKVGDTEYTASAGDTEYSTAGGLYGAIAAGVTLEAGINEITVSGNDLVAFKLIEQRENTVSFGDEITVIAGGKIVNSGDKVADSTTISISAYSADNLMLDRILVNGVEISGGKYFIFNEDVEIKAEFTDVISVTVTFDDDVAVILDGALLTSGDQVRGDATLRFSSRASSGIRAVYSVNGQEISGNTYTLNKADIHVSVELTPYDLIYIEEYEIGLFEETETALRYLLPAVGEYGSDITWQLEDSSKGDAIEEYDSGNYVLSAEMAANGYETREIKLTAKITVSGVEYTVEKTVIAESKALQDIGGREFYIRAIGDSEADLVIENGQFAVSGKGGDLWTAPDGFGYLYTKTNDEDFTISVKVDKIEGTNQWRRMGIMLRESTDDGARFVMLALGANNGAGLEFSSRSADNGSASYVFRNTGYVSGKSTFGYIKLEKIGSSFNAYYSDDGETYEKLNSEPIELEFDGEYLAGLFSESETGYTYFSRFEINGGDVLVAEDITNPAYSPADGKIKVTWTDPEEYSTFTFDSIVVTADCGDGSPVSAEVSKGVQQVVLEGLENNKEYAISIQAKTGELCGEEINNALPYSALSKPVIITAMPFSAAKYAGKTPELTLSLSSAVMVGERNSVALEFTEAQPLSDFNLSIKLPSGVSVDESSISLVEGCEVQSSADGLVISYSGSGSVKQIGTIGLVAENTGSYIVSVEGTASYYSFEDGMLTTANAELASAEVAVMDVLYVTLTFDNRITATINGEKVESGAVVRGDSIVELSCSVPENAELVYIVNGEAVTSSTVVLNKTDTYIGCEIIPYDVEYVRDLELVQRTETEAGVLFDLPARGEYGSTITWTLKDDTKGDTITLPSYDMALLTANMADNNYVDRSIDLIASIKFNNEIYTVEKTVYADTNILHELGGINFFLRQIGQDDQSTAAVSVENNQIVLSGYGTDLWTTPDSFGYFYTKTGDENFTVSAKIDLQQGSNQWRRSGLMFRQSDSETEKMVMLDVGAGNGAALEFAYRVGTTGSANQLARNYGYANAIWLKLEKIGNKFYAYVSTDGEEYTLISEASATVTMNDEYLVGIFTESETGSTYFSRLELNGDDVFVSNDITNAAVTPSEGKIKVTWEDPAEYGERSFEDILITVTDGRKTQTITVDKGTQETVIENLTNNVMYTVTIQARTALLCGENSDNGASSYTALSAPITLTAFPADVTYLAATKPVVSMTASKSVVVGQSNSVKTAFEEMQPIYKLNLSVDIPDGVSVDKEDIKLSETLVNAGGTFELTDEKLTITYEAANSDGIVYLTDLFSFNASAAKTGSYTLTTSGTVTYYSFEIGELSAEVSDKSNVSFSVEAERTSSSSSGSSSGGKKSTSSGGITTANIAGSSGTTLEPAPEATDVFVDKADIPSWASASVGRLTQRGIVSGIETDEGLKFLPNADVTREQFVKLCVLAFMKVDSSAQCSFSDVDSSAWYYPYIATMVQAGIIQGYDDGRFGIGDTITRQDMAVIIYKLYQNGYIRLLSGPVTQFADADSIASYALEAVMVLRAAGVIDGYENNTYAPEENVTRAAAAKVIYGCMN